MDVASNAPKKRTISLLIDLEAREATLGVDGRLLRSHRLFDSEFGKRPMIDPEFLAYVTGSIRFYPPGGFWIPTAKHLGITLKRLLQYHFSDFEMLRELLTAESGAENVTIEIGGTADSLALPFELLCDSAEQSFLIHHHPLFRRTPVAFRKRLPSNLDPEKIESSDLRVLIIKASVWGEMEIQVNGRMTDVRFAELSGVEEEAVTLTRIFPKAVIISQKHSAPTLDEVRDYLKQQWDIVHFAGHGIYLEGELSGILLSRSGNRHDPFLVDTHQIEELFTECAGVKFVYLNSCEGAASPVVPTETRPTFHSVISGMSARSILAFRWPITDNVANIMAKRFYAELLRGQNLESALLQARKSIFREFEEDNAWASAVLVSSVS